LPIPGWRLGVAARQRHEVRAAALDMVTTPPAVASMLGSDHGRLFVGAVRN
jgi:hypothetical protein